MRPAIAPRPLTGLAALLGLTYTEPGAVTGITHDSRSVRDGDLYVAIPGSTTHGAAFAEQAVNAGATAILTDAEGAATARSGTVPVPVLVVADPRRVLGTVAAWVYGEPSAKMQLLGVTGTSGKTTMTYFLERGLAAAGHHTGLVGTVETRIGDDVMPSSHTTPEATDLQAIFARMQESDVSAAAVEVSSHALAFGRADGTVYDVAIFTNLSPEHLDFHHDLEDYFAAKALLFTPQRCRSGVVNADDAYGQRLVEQARPDGVPITTFSPGGSPAADWRAEGVRHGADGSVFRVVGPGGIEADASVQLAGPHNVANGLGAIVALVEAGIPLGTAVLGVSSLASVPGRLERVDAGQQFVALVDYAHKPGAVEAVLQGLRPLTRGRLVVVLGCGGDRDKAKRPVMGEAAARLADLTILTSDNPRSEDPLDILTKMVAGALDVPQRDRAHVVVEPDRAAAISLAASRADPEDVVVVAGKGHEQGQEIAGTVHPFDDRAALRASLDALRAVAVEATTEEGLKGTVRGSVEGRLSGGRA